MEGSLLNTHVGTVNKTLGDVKSLPNLVPFVVEITKRPLFESDVTPNLGIPLSVSV